MTIRKNIINSSDWEPITEVGESGTCWVQRKPLRGQLVLSHTDTGDTNDLEEDESYSMSGEKRDIIIDITADSEDDIFYAKCVEAGATAVIISDVR